MKQITAMFQGILDDK